MRAAVAIIGLLALGGCAGDVSTIDQPSMYISMANGGAKLDPQAAASMISLYRQNNGLGGVAIDPELMKLAESQSLAMASLNKLDHAVTMQLPALPFRDDAFDVVLCSEVFEHLVQPVAAPSFDSITRSNWRDRMPHCRSFRPAGRGAPPCSDRRGPG